MLVAKLEVQLRLYASTSLKEKRWVVKSVKQRLRNRFNVAVAEIGEQESWRDAVLGIVTLANTQAGIDREVDAVTRFLDNDVRFEVVDRHVDIY